MAQYRRIKRIDVVVEAWKTGRDAQPTLTKSAPADVKASTVFDQYHKVWVPYTAGDWLIDDPRSGLYPGSDAEFVKRFEIV